MGVRPRLLLAALTVIVLAAPALDSCTYDNPPVLELDNRPDAPIEGYAAGRLGIVEPSYAHSHLVVAYRYLSGRPLTSIEQQGVLELMRIRLGEPKSKDKSAADQWLEARRVIPGALAIETISPFSQHANYYNYLNCTDDAFRTAMGTLHDRASRFGAASEAVKSWLAAQDLVFGSCSENAAIPSDADFSMPPLIKKDRAYQIASASFYSEEFDAAHDAFAEIAADHDSPWSSVSALVAVRCLIRASTLPAQSSPLESPRTKDPLMRAEKEVRAILSDKKRLVSIHQQAQDLLQFIRIITEPETVIEETAERLASGTSPATFGRDLADYTVLLDRNVTTHHSLTQWIDNMQAGNFERTNDAAEKVVNQKVAEAYDAAHERWRSQHELPWLVAAITHATGNEPSIHEVLDAAKSVPVTSPAFVTITYHRLRLLRVDAAWRRDLDAMLAQKDDVLPTGPRNDFRGLRLPYETSFDDFLRDAPRQIAGYYDQSTPDTPQWLFDSDGTSAINRSLTLDLLVKAAGDARVPKPLDRMLLVAAFTRAHLLGRDDVAISLAPRVVAAYPDMAAAMDRFIKAAPGERKWEGINFLVYHPGLLPYVRPLESRGSMDTKLSEEPHQGLHENWWCSQSESYINGVIPGIRTEPGIVTPQFSEAPAIHKRVEEEQQILAAVGSGSTYLLRGVVAWSNAHPNDPRIPDALARVIKTTQWACPDVFTHAAARAAFDLLHSRYPKSAAAKRTRYWYDGGSL